MTSSHGQWIWQKSSFSQGNGNSSCVEVGRWRTSSFSQGSGNSDCVEVGRWQKSTFSEGSGNSSCVEISWTSPVTAVRDSKNPAGGMLTVPESAWHAFRASIAH